MSCKGQMFQMIKIIIYVCFSAGGLVLLKLGTAREFEIGFGDGVFCLKVNGALLCGMVLYVLSFITSLVVMKGMNLSVFYPVSAGLMYVAVAMASYFIMKETITIRQLLGMGLILLGIIIMNIKK